MDTISYDQFRTVDMRVGRIVAAEAFPEARKPAYKLTIDFGELGTKKSSAQITQLYTPDQLVGRLVVCVVNFEPKQIGPFLSECLTMGVDTDNGVALLGFPEGSITPGTRVY